MSTLLDKALRNEPITDNDIADALYDICEHVHSTCDSECPVYRSNGHKIPVDDGQECICFKNGHAMLRFLRTNPYQG